MQSTISLVEATANKIEERIRKIVKLRKEMISNTNNFREFKIIKSEVIHQLVEYESDFRQLSTIIKSVTAQNLVQKENAEIKDKQLERLENKVKILEKENYQILETNQELQRRMGSVTTSNCDKDSYINDLLTKVNYLENIIKDYQKKYETVRISPETFEHNIPGRTNNYLSKYNEFSRSMQSRSIHQQNNSPSYNYKKDLNLNYDYNREYLDVNSHNYAKREAMNSSSINIRPRSTHYFKESNLSNLEADSRYYNYVNRSNVNNLNEDLVNNQRAGLNHENNKRSDLSGYTRFEKSNIPKEIPSNNNDNKIIEIKRDSARTPIDLNKRYDLQNDEIRGSNLSNIINERESNANNLRLSNINMINDFNDEKENDKVLEESEALKNFIENNSVNYKTPQQADFAKSNGGPFKKANEPQLINSAEGNEILANPILNEKDKANLVSEILLKVFSSDSINTTLKRKYGEDFQFKLTDKNVDGSFLLEVEKDVRVLINKEKSENKPNENKANNVNYKELRKSLRTYSPEGKYIDPNNHYIKKKILEMTKNSKNNKASASQYNFSELLKSSTGFDNTCKSLDKNNNNNDDNCEGRERSTSSKVRGFDLIKAGNAKKAQGSAGSSGYTSLKDYFILNSNFVKGLDKGEPHIGKLNKSGSNGFGKMA